MGSLPQLARLCDLAGVGTARGITESNSFATLDVQTYWHGNPGTNTIVIKASPAFDATATDGIVTNGMVCAFILATNTWRADENVSAGDYVSVFSWAFLTNPPPSPSSTRTWYSAKIPDNLFPVTLDGGELYTYASNLVHFAKVAPDVTNFLNVVIDGFTPRTNIPNRIGINSAAFLEMVSKVETQENMMIMWNNTNLISGFRKWMLIDFKNRFNYTPPPPPP